MLLKLKIEDELDKLFHKHSSSDKTLIHSVVRSSQ